MAGSRAEPWPCCLRPPRPLVSVLVCTFNREQLLGGALHSLLAQTGIAHDAYEIVVVDDLSTDGTQQVVRAVQQASPVRLISAVGAHTGLGAARNLAASLAGGTWLAFFDDDQIAAPRWLASLLARVSAAHADGAGGRIDLRPLKPFPPDLPPTVRRLLGEKHAAKVRRLQWQRDTGPALTIPGTGNALVRSDLFARLGGFRPDMNHGEDTEFFRRARQAGARFVYADDAPIEHLVPPARLRRAYLLSVARKGASVAAALDLAEFGPAAVAAECVLRLGHAIMIKLPALLHGIVRRRHGAILGTACSVAYSTRYCATGLGLCARRLVGARTPLYPAPGPPT